MSLEARHRRLPRACPAAWRGVPSYRLVDHVPPALAHTAARNLAHVVKGLPA